MRRLAAVLAAVMLGGCGSAAAPAVEETPAPEATEAAVEETPAPEATEAAVETPAATPTPGPAAVTILIEDDALTVSPRSVARDQGAIDLHLDNAMDDTAEVILARGMPGSSERKIQAALVTGDAVQAGRQQLDRVRVEPGRYTLILRMPSTSGQEVLDAVPLRVVR